MSDYQRFVSYLYEYCNNEKSRNCGFVRTEVRNSQCKLEVHMKLPPYPFLPIFRVYVFVPTETQLTGIPIGTAHYQQGTVYGTFTISEKNIGGTPWNVNDLGGVLIQADSGQYFATAWKEIPVHPDSFSVFENKSTIHAASIDVDPPSSSLKEPDAVQETSPTVTAPESSDRKDFWTKFQESYPHIQPFFDDEIHHCLKLSTKALPLLNEHGIPAGSNQFLIHSCYVYHHFLLGKFSLKTDEKYVLAVPGIYDEKERYLAKTFGFPYFKPSRNPMVRPGQFGYWYRFLF